MEFKKDYGLIEGYAPNTTSGGTLALTNTSYAWQRFTGSANHTVTLPQCNLADPNDMAISQEFNIQNRSTGTITVNYFGGALAKSIAAGQQASFHLVDKSTAAGSWHVSNESSGGGGSATLSSLEKLGALTGLANMVYSDGESEGRLITINPEEIGGDYWLQTGIATLPAGRDSTQSINLNGFLYTAGGWNSITLNPGPTNRYDLDTNYFLARANLGTPEYQGLGLSTAFGYLIGGATIADAPSAAVQKYNDSADTWGTATSLLVATADNTGFKLNGNLYSCGGGANNTAAYVYNETANAWYIRQPLQNNHVYASGFDLNNYGYVCGSSPGVAIVERYSDAVNSWLTMKPLTAGRRGSGGSTTIGTGVIHGGYDGSSFLSSVEQFFDSTNYWMNKTPMTTTRYGQSGTSNSLNGFVMAIGGSNGGSPLSTVEKYTPVSLFASLIAKRSTSAAASIFAGVSLNKSIVTVPVRLRTDGDNWKFFEANKDSVLKLSETLTDKFLPHGPGTIMGGDNGGGATTVTETFNYLQNVWTTRATLALAIARSAGFKAGGFGFNAGGQNASSVNVATNVRFDDITNTYLSKASMTGVAAALAMPFSIQNLGYVVGSYQGSISNDNQQYNAVSDSWAIKAVLPSARRGGYSWDLYDLGYVVGGDTSGSGTSTSVGHYYSPVLNTWTSITAMPGAREFGSTGVSVIGYGWVHNDDSGANINYRYDPNLGTWATKTAVPSQMKFSAEFRFNDLLIVAGGNNGAALSLVREYNPYSDVWATKTSLTTGRYFVSPLCAGPYRNYELQVGLPSYLAALGGYQFITRTNSIGAHSSGCGHGNMDGKTYVIDSAAFGNSNSEYYNHEANSWLAWVVNPLADSGGQASFVLGGRTYMANGPANATYVANAQLNTIINLSAAVANQRFRVLQSASNPLNGYGWWYGGDQNNSSTLLNSIDRYDQAANNWIQKATSNANSPRYCGGFCHNGFIYIIGGNDTTSFLSTVDRYNDASNTWVLRQNYPFAVTSNVTNTKSGFPVVVGGYNGGSTSAVYKYIDSLNVWIGQANFIGGGRDTQATDNLTGLVYNGDPGVSADNLIWKMIPAIQNVVLGAALRVG